MPSGGDEPRSVDPCLFAQQSSATQLFTEQCQHPENSIVIPHQLSLSPPRLSSSFVFCHPLTTPSKFIYPPPPTSWKVKGRDPLMSTDSEGVVLKGAHRMLWCHRRWVAMITKIILIWRGWWHTHCHRVSQPASPTDNHQMNPSLIPPIRCCYTANPRTLSR